MSSLLFWIYLGVFLHGSVSSVSASQEELESNTLFLIARDISPSMSDDIDEMEENLAILSRYLKDMLLGSEIAVIDFSTWWEEKFVGNVRLMPSPLAYEIGPDSQSAINEAVRGLSTIRMRLDPLQEKFSVGFLFSDFWHQDGILEPQMFQDLALFDQVFLVPVGFAEDPMDFSLFPVNCQVSSTKDVIMALKTMAPDEKLSPNPRLMNYFILASLLLVVCSTAYLLIRSTIIKRRKMPVETILSNNTAKRSHSLLRLRVKGRGPVSNYSFDLDEKQIISIGRRCDLSLENFNNTRLYITRAEEEGLMVTNDGENVVMLNGQQLSPGKSKRTKPIGTIQVPYIKDGIREQAVINFMGEKK